MKSEKYLIKTQNDEKIWIIKNSIIKENMRF